MLARAGEIAAAAPAVSIRPEPVGYSSHPRRIKDHGRADSNAVSSESAFCSITTLFLTCGVVAMRGHDAAQRQVLLARLPSMIVTLRAMKTCIGAS